MARPARRREGADRVGPRRHAVKDRRGMTSRLSGVIAGLAIAAVLVVPSIASASSQEGCPADPDTIYASADCYQTRTVEEDEPIDDVKHARKLHCQSVSGVRIWKNRPNVSCAMARQLARFGSSTTSYK